MDEHQSKSKVMKVDSEETWNSYVNHQDCPIVVHFTAAWCMPSVVMNHFFEELALNYQDVLFLSVDVDDIKAVATKMDVKAMPTFLIMKNGAQVNKLVGANSEEVKRRIDEYLDSNPPSQKED